MKPMNCDEIIDKEIQARLDLLAKTMKTKEFHVYRGGKCLRVGKDGKIRNVQFSRKLLEHAFVGGGKRELERERLNSILKCAAYLEEELNVRVDQMEQCEKELASAIAIPDPTGTDNPEP